MLSDCDECMANNPTAMRQVMRCGFMPAAAHVDGGMWTPADGTELSVCAGYSTQLPDVLDVACNFAHWKNGALDHVCPNGAPKPLLDGLTLFEAAGESRSAYRMREAQKNKGGAGG